MVKIWLFFLVCFFGGLVPSNGENWIGIFSESDDVNASAYDYSENIKDFEEKIKARWDDGFDLENVEYASGEWFGVFHKSNKELLSAYSYSTSLSNFKSHIRDRWDQGYMLVSVEYGDGYWFGLFHKYAINVASAWSTGADLNAFEKHVKKRREKNYFLVDLTIDKYGWFGVFHKVSKEGPGNDLDFFGGQFTSYMKTGYSPDVFEKDWKETSSTFYDVEYGRGKIIGVYPINDYRNDEFVVINSLQELELAIGKNWNSGNHLMDIAYIPDIQAYWKDQIINKSLSSSEVYDLFGDLKEGYDDKYLDYWDKTAPLAEAYLNNLNYEDLSMGSNNKILTYYGYHMNEPYAQKAMRAFNSGVIDTTWLDYLVDYNFYRAVAMKDKKRMEKLTSTYFPLYAYDIDMTLFIQVFWGDFFIGTGELDGYEKFVENICEDKDNRIKCKADYKSRFFSNYLKMTKKYAGNPASEFYYDLAGDIDKYLDWEEDFSDNTKFDYVYLNYNLCLLLKLHHDHSDLKDEAEDYLDNLEDLATTGEQRKKLEQAKRSFAYFGD